MAKNTVSSLTVQDLMTDTKKVAYKEFWRTIGFALLFLQSVMKIILEVSHKSMKKY